METLIISIATLLLINLLAIIRLRIYTRMKFSEIIILCVVVDISLIVAYFRNFDSASLVAMIVSIIFCFTLYDLLIKKRGK